MSPAILRDLSALKRTSAHGGASICLCMIVKNEAHIVRRCLDSVKPYISSWCIVDTGSTDGTQMEIVSALGSMPGNLHQRPWVDFSHNRNEALELSYLNGTDYVLTIDADEVLISPPLHSLTADVYTSKVVTTDDIGERVLLIKNGYPGRWVGAIHEDMQQTGQWALITDSTIRSLSDGARSRDPQKLNKDLCVLFGEIQKDPKNPRNYYYLGATYLMGRDLDQAEKAFRMRMRFQGDPVELARSAKYLEQIKRSRA